MKYTSILLFLLGLALSTFSYAASSERLYGGPYGASWAVELGVTEESIATGTDLDDLTLDDITENTDIPADELGDLESLILLIIEKDTNTLRLTPKDILRARNIQSTYARVTALPDDTMPATGADPTRIALPHELPATGVGTPNSWGLFVALFASIGLIMTLCWKRETA